MKLLVAILAALLLLGGGVTGLAVMSGSDVARICQKDTPGRLIQGIPGRDDTYNQITTEDGTEYTVEDGSLFESLKKGAVYRLSYSGEFDISSTDLEGAEPVEDSSIPPCAA